MVELRERTECHVRIYYARTQDPEIRALLPIAANTIEDALAMYHASLKPEARSAGRTIYWNGQYVGDVWCYGLGETEPDAMLSYCIFEKEIWGQGIATEAVRQFLNWAVPRYRLRTVGAFAYRENVASVRVLMANGFRVAEEFTENGVASVYCERRTSILGQTVTVTIDRPLGSRHSNHPEMVYPVNYGYVDGVIAPDGEEQDVYVLGVDKPVDRFNGRVIAIIHRIDDVEDKWVVVPEGMSFTADEILSQVHFQEQYFHSTIIMEDSRTEGLKEHQYMVEDGE